MGQAQRIVDRHSVSWTGTAYRAQAQVSRTSTGYFIEQVQPIWDRHSESSTVSTYQGQAQRIEDRHSVSKTGTATTEPAILFFYCTASTVP